MLLIASAKFCDNGLEAEYGNLPPSFLPIGNKRLYELQIQQFKKYSPNENIFLSLPEKFQLPKYDEKILSEFNVNIIKVPLGLSIGESLYYVLSKCNILENLHILYGDTYISDLDFNEKDVCMIGSIEDEYEWYFIEYEKAICGYFSFNNMEKFFNMLSKTRYNFFSTLKLYEKTIGLKNIFTSKWYDFGHVNTYYKSKTLISTSRYFNSLKFKNFIVTKKSDNNKKCEAEANWYLNVPSIIKVHTPNFLGKIHEKENFVGYNIEHLYLSSISELFVFSALKELSWNKIIQSTFTLLEKFKSIKTNIKFDHQDFYLKKTLERVSEFSKHTGFNLKRTLHINGEKVGSINEIIYETYNLITPSENKYICFSHGDLCLSNILYDFRSNSIKVIDPRAINNQGEFTLYGDIRYDLAKLAHSIIGKYDLIIAGRMEFSFNDNKFYIDFPDKKDFIEMLLWKQIANFIPNIKLDIYYIMIHLFISMLPLHSDSKIRQMALLANALRLYKEVKSL